MSNWYILRSFLIVCDLFWYIFLIFGMLRQEKSGNPVAYFGQIKKNKTEVA
jgi:hypothetical protein